MPFLRKTGLFTLLKHDNIDIQILQDKKNGKEQPWRPKKVRSLKLADSFKRLGNDKKSSRVRFCGDTLAFAEIIATGERKLHDANFCRERLCPMCAWRRSKKVFYQVSHVMDKIQAENSSLVPIFLTLTLQNCSGKELSLTLDTIFSGWYHLTNHRKFKRIVQGWFRALEITYNQKGDTFHPHVHAILLVDKSYFKSKDYMETTEWVKMWRTALKLDYDPICDVRKVRGNRSKAVAEIAKYTLKDTEYISDDNELTDKLVRILGDAMKGRRLFAFGGLMKKAAKELGIKSTDVGEGDLINVDGQELRQDVDYILRVYRWSMGLANYVLEENKHE